MGLVCLRTFTIKITTHVGKYTYIREIYHIHRPYGITPPKFNSSPLKNDGWKEDDPASFWLWYMFRGELLNFRGVLGCPWNLVNIL